MRYFLADMKTIIAELIGIIGGFFWARATSWDYEPLILLCVSSFGLVISLYFLFNKENPEPQIVHVVKEIKENESSQNKISVETPEAIENKIAAVAKFQEDDIANHYVGLIVQWHLKLFLIHKRNLPAITVVMKSVNGAYTNISFDTNTNAHPIFKIAEDKKEFLVKGEIIKSIPYSIELKLIELAVK